MDNTLSAGRFHIVILEDNEADLYIMRQSLREAIPACDITAFADGGEALAYVNRPMSRVPDLVILDFKVPSVDGASVLNGIRGNSRWAHAAVFMFTTSQNPADMARVKMLGADDYFIKPIDVAGFEKFGRAISEWLEQRALAMKQKKPGEPEQSGAPD